MKLLDYDEFQLEDPVEKLMEKQYALLANELDMKSEMEVNAELQRAVMESTGKHAQVMDGLVYAILTQPGESSRLHFRYMSLCVRDHFAHAQKRLAYFSGSLFPNIQRPEQFFWLTEQLVAKSTPQMDAVLLQLLKNIRGGDVSMENLTLIEQLLNMLNKHRSTWTIQHHGIVATSVYVFLRTIMDHAQYPQLRQREVEYCVSMLREHFKYCSNIGRDLLRLLYEVQAAGITELAEFTQELYSTDMNTIPGFEGVEKLAQSPTPIHFLQCHLPHRLQTEIQFILEKVSWGENDDTYFQWLWENHFANTLNKESILADVIRFVAGALPSTTGNGGIPRFAAIGKLLKFIKEREVPVSVKLALYFDWMGFDPSKDALVALEPGMLLIDRSAEKYASISEWALVFLDTISRELYPPLTVFFRQNIGVAARMLREKGVVGSFQPLLKINPRVAEIVKQLFLDESVTTITENPEQLQTQDGKRESKDAAGKSETVSMRVVSPTGEKLWMFGDLLTDFRKEQDDASALGYLKDILKIAVKMKVDCATLANQLAPRLEIIAEDDTDDVLFFHLFESAEEGKHEYFTELLRSLMKTFESGSVVEWRILHRGIQQVQNSTAGEDVRAFALYLSLLEGSSPELAARDFLNLEASVGEIFDVIPILFGRLPALCCGNMSILRQIVAIADPSNMYQLVWSLHARQFELFGSAGLRADLIATSVEWDSFEQTNLWTLLLAEFSMANDAEVSVPVFVQDLVQLVDVNEQHDLALGLLTLIKNTSHMCQLYRSANTLRALLCTEVSLEMIECPFHVMLLQWWYAQAGARDELVRTLEHVMESSSASGQGEETSKIYANIRMWMDRATLGSTLPALDEVMRRFAATSE